MLDTNVLVSALGFGGRPLDALLATIDGDKQLVVSEETLAELERVMTYDRLPFTEADRQAFLLFSGARGNSYDPTSNSTSFAVVTTTSFSNSQLPRL